MLDITLKVKAIFLTESRTNIHNLLDTVIGDAFLIFSDFHFLFRRTTILPNPSPKHSFSNLEATVFSSSTTCSDWSSTTSQPKLHQDILLLLLLLLSNWVLRISGVLHRSRVNVDFPKIYEETKIVEWTREDESKYTYLQLRYEVKEKRNKIEEEKSVHD